MDFASAKDPFKAAAKNEVLFQSAEWDLYCDGYAEDWVLVVETDTDFATDFAKATISIGHGKAENPRARLDAYLGE